MQIWNTGRRLALLVLAVAALARCGGPEEAAYDSSQQNHEFVAGAVDTSRVELYYVCGTTFKIRNYNVADVYLTWKIPTTGETGTVIAPPPPTGASRSETLFQTKTVGTLVLYYQGVEINRYANQGKVCPDPVPLPPPTSPPPTPSNSQLGSWTAPQTWPVVPIHASLLPTGKVMAWSRLGDANEWDPATNTFTLKTAPDWLFCAGQTLLGDGRLLVAGGHITDDHGLPTSDAYDPFSRSWSSQPRMRSGRWYPTLVNLPNDEVLVLAGAEEDGSANPYPEIRSASTGQWRQLTGAYLLLPYYPFVVLAPDGRAFMSGTHPQSRWLDVTGTGKWTLGPRTTSGITRNYGAQVMIDAGKLVILGGGIDPTNSVETIDLNQGNAATFKPLAPMIFKRRQVNATMLPDGELLVTGGTSAYGFNNAAGAVYEPELYDPGTNTWRKLAPMKLPRLYHSTALLLPDGRVMSGGGGEGGGGTIEKNIEIFSPPYLFKSDGTLAPRPVIDSAPAQITYGQGFTVSSAQAGNIRLVTLIRLGSTTHGMNMSQSFNRLPFTVSGNTLTVTAPLKQTVATKGYYMLFIVDANGVPSVSKMVQLR